MRNFLSLLVFVVSSLLCLLPPTQHQAQEKEPTEPKKWVVPPEFDDLNLLKNVKSFRDFEKKAKDADKAFTVVVYDSSDPLASLDRIAETVYLASNLPEGLLYAVDLSSKDSRKDLRSLKVKAAPCYLCFDKRGKERDRAVIHAPQYLREFFAVLQAIEEDDDKRQALAPHRLDIARALAAANGKKAVGAFEAFFKKYCSREAFGTNRYQSGITLDFDGQMLAYLRMLVESERSFKKHLERLLADEVKVFKGDLGRDRREIVPLVAFSRALENNSSLIECYEWTKKQIEQQGLEGEKAEKLARPFYPIAADLLLAEKKTDLLKYIPKGEIESALCELLSNSIRVRTEKKTPEQDVILRTLPAGTMYVGSAAPYFTPSYEFIYSLTLAMKESRIVAGSSFVDLEFKPEFSEYGKLSPVHAFFELYKVYLRNRAPIITDADQETYVENMSRSMEYKFKQYFAYADKVLSNDQRDELKKQCKQLLVEHYQKHGK